jgi:hypothetical protein
MAEDRSPSRKSEALKLAHNALTFAKPMIGALCADSPTADVREKRNKVYAKVEAALEAVIEEMKESASSETFTNVEAQQVTGQSRADELRGNQSAATPAAASAPSSTRRSEINIAEDAITLFLEYRDKHGHSEPSAMVYAVNEFSEAELFEAAPSARGAPSAELIQATLLAQGPTFPNCGCSSICRFCAALNKSAPSDGGAKP